MTVEGTWTLSIDTPIGKQAAELVLSRDGNRLTGTLADRTATLEIIDGVVSGDVAVWKVVKTTKVLVKKIKVPVTFTVTVEGDRMRGRVSTGRFGAFAVNGLRVR
ncbi:hypothetical protein [Paractinoplanes durhamensis]|uniref:Uncharacterized protein n=1 Tax=Paractinoplanes durhamensis TaxID=113563 RepID=A0ABQ3ZDH8_9ACTN|nr:hypothetical protein [Actinoplanes durhamensis]GIE07885.1 hypothetical protein Adu01nite_92350 [Actinoplanes durhamensis]